MSSILISTSVSIIPQHQVVQGGPRVLRLHPSAGGREGEEVLSHQGILAGSECMRDAAGLKVLFNWLGPADISYITAPFIHTGLPG